jgi:uncharacterized protein (DUF4415 family)
MKKKSIPRTSSIKISDEIRKAWEERDRQYDNTDAAPLPPEKWANAVVGKFYRPIKQPIALRLDADVLAWLKTQGAGYQSRINEILRREMTKSLKQKRA